MRASRARAPSRGAPSHTEPPGDARYVHARLGVVGTVGDRRACRPTPSVDGAIRLVLEPIGTIGARPAPRGAHRKNTRQLWIAERIVVAALVVPMIVVA